MKYTPLFLVLTLCLTGWAFAQKKPTPQPDGLRTAPLMGTNAKVVKTTYEGEAPGENRTLERSYHTAPPMIPHTVEDYLPITTRNECLKCHLNPPKALIKQSITVVPDSHFVNREGKDIGGTIATQRNIYAGFWNCSMCHAPQADAKPLVGNDFKRDQ